MTQIVYGPVRELVRVESLALVRNSLPANKGNSLKKGSQQLCKDCSHIAAGPAKREEGGHDLLPLGVPQGLIKGRQEGLGEVAVPRET